MITMAESKDPEGKAGTWKKWDGSDFTVEGCNQETGLGGINTSIAGLRQYHGGNPSVMYNTWLGKWIMVYHCWQRYIVISYSDDGIVWEYDDRIPWQSWPGTWRGGYTIQEQRRLMDACRKLELETVPLIQIQGHLEWLLKHERYSGWRENGVSNELCPLHPEVLPRLKKWIDEITTLHPGSRFLHLGEDETWYMGK